MNCKKCGSILNANDIFCGICGTRVEEIGAINNPMPTPQNVELNTQSITPANHVFNNIEPTLTDNNNEGAVTVSGDSFISQKTSTLENNIVENTNQSGYVEPININTQTSNNQVNQTTNVNNGQNKKISSALIGLILCIVGGIISNYNGIIPLPLYIAGLVFAIKDKKRSAIKTITTILSILGIIGAILGIILTILFNSVGDAIEDLYGNTDNETPVETTPKYYEDEYFRITYDNNWKITTDTDGKEKLMYKDNTGDFQKMGESSLSSATKQLNCNFEDTKCKQSIYSEFYNGWKNSLEKESLQIYTLPLFNNTIGSGFLESRGMYYATFKYGRSENEILGSIYLWISEEKNIIISFGTRKSPDASSLFDTDAMKLINSLEIKKGYVNTEGTGYSTAWENFSNLRTGNLGKNKNLTGGWRVLANTESYWKFTENEFWWYKSVNDLNDNYWQGTTKIYKGREGLRLLGVSETKINELINSMKGELTEQDVYTVICTPIKLIENGIDVSATKITEKVEWKFVWILKNHGSEGIEAEFLNIETADVLHYVKLAD